MTKLDLVYEKVDFNVFSSRNWNTPIVFDLKEGSVSLIVLCDKYFLLVDGGVVQVYNYEGRLQSTLRSGSGSSASSGVNQVDMWTNRTVALSNDIVALRDPNSHSSIELFETKIGKVAGDGKISHNIDVVEVAVNQCGSSPDRRVAFVDINGECFIALIKTYGAARRCEKIGTMISNIHFNNNTNMLCGFRERKVVVWSLPSVVFTDKELLSKTMIELETEDMGKSAFIIGFIGNGVAVRRSDGCLVLCYVPPFVSGLIRAVNQSQFDKALRLCRMLKEDYLWATLAGLAATERNYHVAEIAYGELLDVEKVWFLNDIQLEARPDLKSALMSMFNGNSREAETTFLQSGRIFRAIMLNIQTFRFDKALELATKHKMHIDTVLGYRIRYLDETGRKENDERFLKQLSNVEVDWPHIREKIKLDTEKEQRIK